ncbi:UNVERIFIED_CONTAM: Phytosulfokine receptor 1 [Sesamum radiatum]|uniref:Phytosulfokine receptor 1 n=1 Tax=Sesamum radiatum TaxID=300843 RepID=A0AAW2JSE7_SESRA
MGVELNKDSNNGILLDDLLKATDQFDQSNIIGCGVLVWSTRPSSLMEGRWLKTALRRVFSDGEEFQAEIETLSRAQHQNLVHLQDIATDFGLARLILPYDTHVTTDLVGTLGYIPPEYGQASVATYKGDIYSFGVVSFRASNQQEADRYVQTKSIPGPDLMGCSNETREKGNRSV